MAQYIPAPLLAARYGVAPATITMPRYYIRVQLRETDLIHPNYTKLHKLLKEAGLLESSPMPGGVFRLPNAEYMLIAPEDIDTVTLAVEAIAAAVQANPKVFVCESSNVREAGLEKIAPEDFHAAMKSTLGAKALKIIERLGAAAKKKR
jgi:hypothetical protein